LTESGERRGLHIFFPSPVDGAKSNRIEMASR
jgi:hypothetical protein